MILKYAVAHSESDSTKLRNIVMKNVQGLTSHGPGDRAVEDSTNKWWPSLTAYYSLVIVSVE